MSLIILLTQVGPDLFDKDTVHNNGLNTEEGLRQLVQGEGLHLVVNEYQTPYQRANRKDSFHRTFFLAADTVDEMHTFCQKYQIEGTVVEVGDVYEMAAKV